MSEDVPFKAVPAGLASALEAKGFSELTPVQQAVLAPELADRDLRISSQTGSGKTVAIGFVLAANLGELDGARGRRGEPARPRALLIAPTRELAAQICKELTWLFRPLRARISVVTGGTNLGGDFRILADQPHVLIGTPGRLLDHLKRGSLDLSQTSAVVLDEADEMLDMGFRDDLQAILDGTPSERRTHLMSATIPREVLRLADRYQTNAAPVMGTQPGAANVDITHIGCTVRPGQKFGALINLLLSAPGERTLVFVRTRADTSDLATELTRAGFSASALSGEMSQRERTSTLEAFRRNAVQMLVATDVAARGLDVQDVTRVVHFDLPENAEVFTHRSGRTGRAGNKGTSIVFVPPAGRNRAEHMFRRARVSLQWQDIPTPAEIRKAADARLVAELTAEGAGECATDDHMRALATELLESGDVVAVVAALLARSDHAGPCAPHDIAPVRRPERPRFDDRPRHNERSVRDNHHRGDAPGPRRQRDSNGSFTPFHVGWGANNGASPSRLLAMVCRRGGIRSNHIGAISVGDFRSVVEVATDVAEEFAQAARQPDARNPRVKISPWSDAASPRNQVHRKGGGNKGWKQAAG